MNRSAAKTDKQMLKQLERNYKKEEVKRILKVIEMENKEIVINNKLDPTTTLYHNDVKIGDIENGTALDDVLAQIHIKNDNGEDATGYYIKWGEEVIDILPSGRIPQPPQGFYNSSSESLMIIFGI